MKPTIPNIANDSNSLFCWNWFVKKIDMTNICSLNLETKSFLNIAKLSIHSTKCSYPSSFQWASYICWVLAQFLLTFSTSQLLTFLEGALEIFKWPYCHSVRGGVSSISCLCNSEIRASWLSQTCKSRNLPTWDCRLGGWWSIIVLLTITDCVLLGWDIGGGDCRGGWCDW